MPHLFYPPKNILRGKRGLNLTPKYLLNVDAEHLLKSQDCYYVQSQLRRRQGFSRHSTEDWSAAIFRGGHVFVDDSDNVRLLVGRNGGTVEEIQSAAAHATVLNGLTAAKELVFATGFGATFVANGADTLRRLDATANPAVACTGRLAGIPAKVAGFGAALGAAGARNGDYAFMATAVIESGGAVQLESDWSTLIELTVTADAITFTWTDPSIADSRVTHVYLYGTKVGGIEPYFIRKVALPATTYVNDDTADTALGALAAVRASKTTMPSAPVHVVISGTRLVAFKGKTAYFSRPATTSYDLEAIERQVDLQIPGSFKAAISIPSVGQAVNTNSLWVATDRGCVVFYQTDPTLPQQHLSPEIGCVGPQAVVLRGTGVFWVDKRRGVMYWPGPGAGAKVYCVSEKITPVFKGGGSQNLTANQGDENITLTIFGECLKLTVRDDTGYTGANKVYYMDLAGFERNMGTMGPEAAAVWGGPWRGLGFHRLLALPDGGLIVLDNQYKQILKWDTTTFTDYVNGGATTAPAYPIVRFGPAMQEYLEERKRLHRFYWFGRHGADGTLRVIGQDGQFDYPGIVLKRSGYADISILDGIPLVDIEILKDSGRAEAAMDWSFIAPWFQFEISTPSATEDWEMGGWRVTYTRQKVMIND